LPPGGGGRSLAHPFMAMSPPAPDHATLADFFNLLRQRKVLIGLLTLLVLLTAAVATALMPKWYRSTATVRVEKPDGEMRLFEARGGGGYDPAFLQDQFRIMQAPVILNPVIEQLDLNERVAAMMGRGEAFPTDVTRSILAGRMLRLNSPRNSSLIEITVEARDPRLAAAVANAVARTYSDDRIAFATAAQRESIAQLRRELDVQERNVSAQRDVVERLRGELNLAGINLNAGLADLDIDTLRQLQNSLIALRVDSIGRRTRWERFRDIPYAERVNLVTSELIDDANIQNLLQAYLVADQTVTRLGSRLGGNHPDLVAAIDNRTKIREQLDGQLRGYENALEISAREAEARVAELERQLQEARVEQILSAQDRIRPFEEAVRRLDDETRLLSTLKLTLRQREIDFQVPKRSIEFLGEAEPARGPSKPNWSLNLALALVCGLVLGVGVAGLLEYFDTSFRNVAEVEARLQVPVLGIIPFQDGLAPGGGGGDDDPAAAEPFRVLHANLGLADPTGANRVLVVVSAGPGEGKSTALHHLARAMAAAGEKVLLVDGDLRRPSQHQHAVRARTPGLGEVLGGRRAWTEVMHRDFRPGLDLLTAGGGGNLFGVVAARRLRDLLVSWRGEYDRVLIDSPPIIGVSDATVLAGVADGVLLLIQHRRNPRSMVQRARQVIEGTKTPLLGVIMNQVAGGQGEDYDYYTTNYAYYGEGGRKSRRSGPVRATAGGDETERIELKERQ
jgi:polysaccharide biosynthesis transport protein